ncbi:DNA translocase FtsK [Roseinatronobacter alkalisoli]|uniref:DNA translocase FtsK n=1 Tax=Roseinatronobacter alkalisoli TaxID=3028235 RepID=A0ABT5TA69_9RHOB|nr:DNA translocase FtsK 4TM domain-containing protein [Roseinatronobacter sp. HJB301]MDD7971886.1 DNA translocase FtsK 4TM domain-containing protein [Roseinatronobacter sp. HJB301]
MASYNIDKRDPLLDSKLQAVLQKRGRELAGIGLGVLAVVCGLMLGSYSPADPGWMVTSDAPVQNSLGRLGATIASPLMVIAGVASWGFVLFLGGWGLRLVLGRGHEAVMSRGVFLPLAVAVTSIWCASFVPSQSWDMLYGMGGVFGDTVLGAVVNALPMSPAAGVGFMSLLLLFATLAVWGFVMGVNRHEALLFARFLLTGLILTYAGVMTALRGGVVGGVRGAKVAGGVVARRVQDHMHARAENAHRAPPPPEYYDREPMVQRAQASQEPVLTRRGAPVIRPTGYANNDWHQDDNDVLIDPMVADMPPPARMREPLRYSAPPEEEQRGGLLSKLKSLSMRSAEPAPMPEPELVERQPHSAAMSAQAPAPDRISSRIADAVRHRKHAKPVQVFNPNLRPPLNPGQRPVQEPPLRAPVQDNRQPDPVAEATQPPLAAATFTAQMAAPVLGSVHMPDWMLAAQPVAPEPTPSAEPATPQMQVSSPQEPAMAMRPGQVLQRRVVATAPVKPQTSRQARAEAEPGFTFDAGESVAYELPPLLLLENPANVQRYSLSDEALEENARMLEAVLDDYGVRGEIVSVRPGPVVTQYELEPAPGLKASRVIGLADDIARSMSALSARVSTVPGRSIIGIELPNAHREKVVLREILSARDFGDTQMRLPLALGKAIDGEPVVANLAKMPHLLIAGTTGSGKSVAINTMILSLLYRLTPDECRMIMIDPKMLELSVYDGIPHLLSPVVTDPKKAVVALKWVVGEMEERYRKMSKMGVRNIEGYNGRVREALARGEMFKRTIQTGFDDETGDPVFETEEFAPELLPYIVVVVDEMADLMMVAGKEIEACIQRLAQMARASGIHLIMATQRPSVDVITGTIKANFPTRISFQVTSKIDSRTILGEQGAEQLLGMGDMLYMAGGARITRIHGPFVSDEEVEEIVNHLKSFGPPDYKSGVVDGPESDKEADIDAVLGLGGNTTGEDALYDQAVQVVIQDRKCSTSYIQRKLGIGYNKAARLVEQMEDEGLVTAANHVGKREILIPEQG